MTRRTLLLDLDGTLVDSVPDLMASLNRLMAARDLPAFTAPEVTAMVGDGAAALVAKAMAARGREPGPADVTAFLDDYMGHAVVETRPYPGVPEALDQLATSGWRLAVCTNKPEAAARQVLDTLGLASRVVAIAGGDTYRVRKPDPGHVLCLLSALGATPAQAVMVGDHHNDVLAAQAADVPCIFAAWGYGTLNMAEGAVAVAQRAADLPALLHALI